MPLTDDVLKSVETFVCKMYDAKSNSTDINKVRADLFRNCKSNLDSLPPTRDALVQHLKRVNYQVYIYGGNHYLPFRRFPHQKRMDGF